MKEIIFTTSLAMAKIISLLVLAGFYEEFIWILGSALGLVVLIRGSIESIREKNYSLDYIAFVAIILSYITGDYLAGAVIGLMVSVSEGLEEYAKNRARKSLSELYDRLPKMAWRRKAEDDYEEVPLADIQDGDVILVREKEIVPLDGFVLASEVALDQSHLTGESEPVIRPQNSLIRSGSINLSGSFEMAVHGTYQTSTYQKIIDLVEEGQKHQPGFIKLADKYNYIFTAFTGVVATIAFGFTGELERVLAVLVVATPCPLLIAAPTSFIAGVGKLAKQGIIVKRANALEVVTKVKKIFFDKTGTLTLGTPQFVRVESEMEENRILEIAGALEIHSLHPLAKSLVQEVEHRGLKNLSSEAIEEHLGKGICGVVEGKKYCIIADPEKVEVGIVLSLTENGQEIAELYFDDVMKDDSQQVVKALQKRGFELVMVTGDKRANAERLFGDFGIRIYAQCTPEKKFELVTKAQREGQIVALIGDGLNDAPAIAEADLGVVFSHSENTAAVEAAEFVLVKPDLSRILAMMDISARSMRIARQSIWIGMSLSCTAMIVAAFGYIPPSVGALIQEVIDVSVVLYALRSAR